jgi:5-methylcytosine-specific restriction enzyme A
MGSERFGPFRARHTGKGPNGRPVCCWCGAEVPKGRRRWCGEACVRQMQIQHWPRVWAAEVIKRDKGICQICGFDSWMLGRIIDHLCDEARSNPFSYDTDLYRYREELWTQARKTGEFIRRHLYDQGFKRGSEWVEADHTVPIVEGGANTLENGRTLCVPCHKRETANLARRRKWRRRESGTLLEKLAPEAGDAVK